MENNNRTERTERTFLTPPSVSGSVGVRHRMLELRAAQCPTVDQIGVWAYAWYALQSCGDPQKGPKVELLQRELREDLGRDLLQGVFPGDEGRALDKAPDLRRDALQGVMGHVELQHRALLPPILRMRGLLAM